LGALGQSGVIGVVSPTTWNASSALRVHAPVSVWSGSGAVSWNADADRDGVGALVLSSGSNVTVAGGSASLLSLSGADVDLLSSVGGVVAGACPIAVMPSTSGVPMQLGGSWTPSFYLSAGEVSLLQTSSWLLFGGSAASNVTVDGVSYAGGASPVQLWALHAGAGTSASVGSVTFSGSSSVFASTLDVRAVGSVLVAASVSAMNAQPTAGLPGVSIQADFGAFAGLLVCLFVCLFVCLVACLFAGFLLVCLFVCLRACLLVFLFACLFACLFVCVLVCFFACLFAGLFVCVLVCWFVCLCTCLLVCLLVCFV
jgi:hypothetical protein